MEDSDGYGCAHKNESSDIYNDTQTNYMEGNE